MSELEFEKQADERFNECYSSFRQLNKPCKFAKTIAQIKMLLNAFDFTEGDGRLKLIEDIEYFINRLKHQVNQDSKNSD